MNDPVLNVLDNRDATVERSMCDTRGVQCGKTGVYSVADADNADSWRRMKGTEKTYRPKTSDKTKELIEFYAGWVLNRTGILSSQHVVNFCGNRFAQFKMLGLLKMQAIRITY